MHVDATKDSFKSEVLDQPGLVVVDFWAPWCGPCLQLSPIIDGLDKHAKIVKVNVDTEMILTGQYGVSAIPTVIIFKDGKVVNEITGFHQEKTYLDALVA